MWTGFVTKCSVGDDGEALLFETTGTAPIGDPHEAYQAAQRLAEDPEFAKLSHVIIGIRPASEKGLLEERAAHSLN